jgi:hypothetical protein
MPCPKSSQSQSEPWKINWEVYPEITSPDGFGDCWSETKLMTEGDVESGTNIMLGQLDDQQFKDSDGSEEVLYYELDLSTMIVDAGIRQRLQHLEGKEAILLLASPIF